MTLKLKVDSIEEIEEPLRPLYVEQNGKFVLGVEGAVSQEELATATKKANKEAQELRQKYKVWDTLGKSAEDIQKMLEEHEELVKLREEREMTEAEKKGQWDQLKVQINEKHGIELKKKDTIIAEKDKELADLRRKVEQHLVKSAALSAIADNRGIKDLLLPFVERHLRVDEDFGIRVVDDKGEPKINGSGDPLSAIEFVSEMRSNEVFGRAFEGTGASGSGTRPAGNQGSPHPGVHKKADLKDNASRAKFVDTHGLDAYKRLPD